MCLMSIQNKYYANCNSAINPTANSSAALLAVCSGPAAESETCTTSCSSSFGVPVFGTQSLTCSAGRWMGGTSGFSGPLVCANTCPIVSAPPNAATCSLTQVRLSVIFEVAAIILHRNNSRANVTRLLVSPLVLTYIPDIRPFRRSIWIRCRHGTARLYPISRRSGCVCAWGWPVDAHR